MNSLSKLNLRLEKSFPKMKGAWVEKGSGYESEFARSIGGDVDKQTHWDMKLGRFKIEVKKGQTGGWFDLTRYRDLLNDGEEWRRITTLFLHYDKGNQKVKSLMAITMPRLIESLHLTSKARAAILNARELLNPEKDTRLNFQSRLTADDLRRIARQPPNFVIPG